MNQNPSDGSEMPVMDDFGAYIAIMLANTEEGILYNMVGGPDLVIPQEGGGHPDLRLQVPQVQHHDRHSVQDTSER